MNLVESFFVPKAEGKAFVVSERKFHPRARGAREIACAASFPRKDYGLR